MGGFRQCDSCGVVMGGAPAACPICSTPYAAGPSTPAGTEDAPMIDLRDDKRAGVEPDELMSIDRMATASTGPSATTSMRAPSERTRPKTPLRPYVPPGSPQGGANPFTPPAPAPPPPTPPAAPAPPPNPPGAPSAPSPAPAPPPPLPSPAPPVAPSAPPPTPAPSTAAPLQDRPDPYAQIANPLNTGWGSTPPAPPTAPTPTNPTPIRRRSPWLRRGIVLLVFAAIAGGLWWQRERVEDVVTDLRDRISEESTGPAEPLEPDQG